MAADKADIRVQRAYDGVCEHAVGEGGTGSPPWVRPASEASLQATWRALAVHVSYGEARDPQAVRTHTGPRAPYQVTPIWALRAGTDPPELGTEA